MRGGRTFSIILVAAACGCRSEMFDQPKADPLEASEFFPDGTTARPPVEGTVARGERRMDAHFYTGKIGREFAATFPFEITRSDLVRGMERFNIYCAPCHDRTGQGDGMIVQRGMRKPPSMHEQRLRDSPPGYFFDVITNGFATMFPYADRLSPLDRWRITAYIRVLQRARSASLDDVPPGERARWFAEPPQEEGL